MENVGELIGRWVAVLLLACPAAYFLAKGIEAVPRSRRLANFALFFGLTFLVLPELALELSPVDWPRLFLVSVLARVLFGGLAVVLALAAFAFRQDGGIGPARPVVGTILGLVHAIFGVGLFVQCFPTLGAVPWVYHAPDGAFCLTLPSHRWVQVPGKDSNSVAAFVQQYPQMRARVLSVRRPQTEADFAQVVKAVHDALEKALSNRQGEPPKFREGKTTAGNLFGYFTLMDSTKDGQSIFVARSVVFCPGNQALVDVLFEGLPKMRSGTPKAAEMQTLERFAETICLSVDCPGEGRAGDASTPSVP